MFKNSDSTGTRAIRDLITVQCVLLSKYLKESNKRIDLLEINIEGSEYLALAKLIYTGAIALVDSILIQFHNNDSSHEYQRAAIRTLLRLTHQEIWCYDWVWELWKK